MPDEAIEQEQKYRIIIYHGHIHKIPIDNNDEKILNAEVVSTED